MLDASVPEDSLKPLTGIDYPVFYVNYALNPQAIPWRDSIGRAIRVFRGTEYTISRPRDLWFSMSEHGLAYSKIKAGAGRVFRSILRRDLMRWPMVVAAIALASLPASAQNSRFANKLAPFVTSSVKIVDRMLEMAASEGGRKLYDLGCGDGRILIEAAGKYKVKAVGVEISPKLVEEGREEHRRRRACGSGQRIQGRLAGDRSERRRRRDHLPCDVLERKAEASAGALSQGRRARDLARLCGARLEAPHIERADDRHVHLIYLYEMPPAKVNDFAAKTDAPARKLSQGTRP